MEGHHRTMGGEEVVTTDSRSQQNTESFLDQLYSGS
jgi:hypothetical protein